MCRFISVFLMVLLSGFVFFLEVMVNFMCCKVGGVVVMIMVLKVLVFFLVVFLFWWMVVRFG